MPKKFLYYIAVAVGFLIFLGILYLTAAPKSVIAPSANKTSTEATQSIPPSFIGNEDSFKNALNLYIQKSQEGVDMTNGPCLGKIGEDWVLDIAHKPRLAVDDKPENQCADYLSGKVHHFIEFNPNGQLIDSQ